MSEDRRGVSVIVTICSGSITDQLRFKEPIASSNTIECSRTARRISPFLTFKRLGDPIERRSRIQIGSLVGASLILIIGLSLNPLRPGGSIIDVGRFRRVRRVRVKFPGHGIPHFIRCPLNIGQRLLIGRVPNIGVCLILRNRSGENLDALKGRTRVVVIFDRHIANRRSHRRTLSKRHGHRGHDSAEAQRCCEAGGYCQACDVLAHAHLLFLCFLLEFHLI